MVVAHLLTHGLFFTFILNGSLLLVMVLTSPHIWGYADYPVVIKIKVPPPNKKRETLLSDDRVTLVCLRSGVPHLFNLCPQIQTGR